MSLKHTTTLVIALLLCSGCVCCQSHDFTNSPVKISYTVYGHGKPVLLINGGPGYSSKHLTEVASHLASFCQVILFDQRGTGQSRVTKYDTTTIGLDQTLYDIEQIRSALKLDSWIVAGHSFGGLIAMAYTAAHGDRVEKLILISSAGYDLSFIRGFQDNIVNIIGADTLKYQTPRGATNEQRFLNMVKVNAPAYVFDKSKTELVRKNLVDSVEFVYDVNRLLFTDLFAKNFDVSEKLKRYDRQALIIQGSQDVVGMDSAYRTHSVLANSRIFFIRRCGHIPWLEQPKIFYNQIRIFLEE